MFTPSAACRSLRLATLGVTATFTPGLQLASAAQVPARPNVIIITADDLGYGDVGVYGQQHIKTPNLDQLAQQGLRFTGAYAGAAVCTPSRAALLTGLHTGHARLRSNARSSLRPEDLTIGEVMKGANYTTAAFGKWGVSGVGKPVDTGNPNVQGFDRFYGYLDNDEAKFYFPDYLWTTVPNQQALQKVPLANNNSSNIRVEYGPDVIQQNALQFIRDHRQTPFFMYYALTAPHAGHADSPVTAKEIDPLYASMPWPTVEKEFASTVTYLDRQIGEVITELRTQGLDQNTVVIFSSDNGPRNDFGHSASFFDNNGPLRGIKRDMYEGGVRVPTIAWAPGMIAEGRTSDLPIAHWDFMATAAHIGGAWMPGNLDGISFVDTMRGTADQSVTFAERALFWRDEADGRRGVRLGDWKAVGSVSNGRVTTIELYNLANDIAETTDLAGLPELAPIRDHLLLLINDLHTGVVVAEVPEPALIGPLGMAAGVLLRRRGRSIAQ